ncbi:MAG: LysR substrate-binding domain-containing protein [Pseudomonadota bacterium]
MKFKLPPLKTLPIFIAVANHLSFSKAAMELCLTHSAVSQAIKQLESFLGCKILERSTNYVKLTKIGKQYLIDIEAAVNQINLATMNINHMANWININLINSLALHWLIPHLPQFQKKYSDIKVNISTTQYPLYEALDRNEIDMIITSQIQSPAKSNYTCIKLWDEELVLVVKPSLISQKINQAALSKLIAKLPILYVDATLRSQDWKNWCKENKLAEPSKVNVYLFPSTTQAIQAAISGMGLLVTHAAYVKDSVDLGLLKILESKIVQTKKSCYMITLKDRINEFNLSAYINFVKSIS